MNHKTLNQAFPIVAAALGNKWGIKVSVGGRDAYTDGLVINIPAYHLDEPAYKEVAWGYLAHEAAHVRFTDFADFKQAATSPLRKAIVNLLEDIRIEKLMQTAYPGTKRTTEKVVEHLLQTGTFKLIEASEQVHPAAVLMQFLLFYLRYAVLGQKALAAYADSAEALLEKTFPAGVVTRLLGLLSELPELQVTRDVVRLSDGILRMLQEEHDQEVETSQAKQAEHDTQADDTVDQEMQQTQESTDSEPLAHCLAATADDLPVDVFEAVQVLLGSQSRHAYDAGVHLPAAIDPVRNALIGQAMLNKVLTESAKIRVALHGLVQASRYDRPLYKRSGQTIEGRKLMRLVHGDTRIFTRRTWQQAPNTALHLLVDSSGSMHRTADQQYSRLIEVAIESAMALALALEGIPGVNPAVTRFPYELTEAVVPLLKHGQKLRTHASAFSYVTQGSTPLHTALWYAAAAVLATKEPRKIMVVLTDGQPDDVDAAQAVIHRCQATGIELVGMGIGMDIGHLFERSMIINKVSELRAALFRISQDLLLSANR